MKRHVVRDTICTGVILLLAAVVTVGQPAPVVNGGARSIGLLWWPADPSKAMYSFSSQINRCLTRHIHTALPEFSIIGHEAVQDMLYPMMEPDTQPDSELEFAELLRRDDVRARLAGKGLRYLVAFSGSTRTDEWNGGVFCGGGYGGAGCLGFAWATKKTALDAVLWDLQKDNGSKHATGSDTGTSMLPAFILPIPLLASTQSDACRELGTRIVSAIEEDEQLAD
jgi:hypothetical protein